MLSGFVVRSASALVDEPEPSPSFVPVQTFPTSTYSAPGASPTFVMASDPIPRPTARPRPSYGPTVADAKAYALAVLGPRQYACLVDIVNHEDGTWNPERWNEAGSGAYGLPQAKPGSKMASAGADWRTNPVTQLRWMIGYVNAKYGSACAAAAFRERWGSY